MIFDKLGNVLNDLRNGKIICLSSRNRKNLTAICLANKITKENARWLIKVACGSISIAISDEWCNKLGFEPVFFDNIKIDNKATPYYQSIDHRECETGTTADDLVLLARSLSKPNPKLSMFVSPGHTNLLKSDYSLLQARKGHTEAAVCLSEICAEPPVVVTCDLLNENADLLLLEQFENWNQIHKLKIICVEDIEKFLKI